MKAFKRFTALVLALVMAAMLAVSAYAATVVVKYKVYVYTSQLTFKQYDYSSSTTPSTRNLTILADSSSIQENGPPSTAHFHPHRK